MKQKDLLFILASSSLLTVIWIGLSIYSSAITSTISDTLGIQIMPIEPTFDRAAIESMKKRDRVSPSFELRIQTTITPTPVSISQPPLQVVPANETISTGNATQSETVIEDFGEGEAILQDEAL